LHVVTFHDVEVAWLVPAVAVDRLADFFGDSSEIHGCFPRPAIRILMVGAQNWRADAAGPPAAAGLEMLE
jgi:hypothetical protein